jgi:hypothetical protein
MHNSNTQLLCTFSDVASYQSDIELMKEFYKIDGGKVYILKNSENPTEIFLTYNVEKNNGKYFPKTISVHRKKDFNILYSINALNELIKQENGGLFSHTYQVDWTKFKDSIIVVNDGKIKIMPTKLLRIFFL